MKGISEMDLELVNISLNHALEDAENHLNNGSQYQYTRDMQNMKDHILKIQNVILTLVDEL